MSLMGKLRPRGAFSWDAQPSPEARIRWSWAVSTSSERRRAGARPPSEGPPKAKNRAGARCVGEGRGRRAGTVEELGRQAEKPGTDLRHRRRGGVSAGGPCRGWVLSAGVGESGRGGPRPLEGSGDGPGGPVQAGEAWGRGWGLGQGEAARQAPGESASARAMGAVGQRESRGQEPGDPWAPADHVLTHDGELTAPQEPLSPSDCSDPRKLPSRHLSVSLPIKRRLPPAGLGTGAALCPPRGPVAAPQKSSLLRDEPQLSGSSGGGRRCAS